MSRIITESDVEQAALDILEELEYKTLYGPDIAPPPEGIKPERKAYSDVVLAERLSKAIDKINPTIPALTTRS
jgi:type I restriction enzyme, R subunit